MLTIGLGHYLVLATLVFALGVAVMLLRRNAVGILIGVELILNSALINFVAADRYRLGGVDGQIAAVFIIVLAAAGAAITLAIFLGFAARHGTIDVDQGDSLRG